MQFTNLFKKRCFHIIAIVLVCGGPSLSHAQSNTFPNSGDVGIGTLNPAARLEVRGIDTFTITLLARPLIGQQVDVFQILNNEGAVSTRIDEFGNVLLGPGPVAYISNNGNVGIGTTSPTSKLHVSGNVRITGNLNADGNIAAKYQDVAEWVPSPTPLPDGSVVVIDQNEVNQVQLATQAYDTRVAGVISARPGILLGEEGKDKAKVAHSGRVKVKADAKYGSIKVGDLLVSSATPGHAMRSMPVNISDISMHRPGTIIGKALEPLKQGEGKILVLVTLH